MEFELTPLTEPGERFTALAERHASDFADRAEPHDREGMFPVQNIEDMKRSGAMLATLPTDMGGMGVGALHDFAVGVNRMSPGRRLDRPGRDNASVSRMDPRLVVANCAES
ncbi:MAG TPA: acyl-CoA dehydrogenase family protein [Actinomycetes bacterium]|nr:acyl-CoA dehydrogenase family protein [Actinomycetes bacterium]